MPRSQPDSSARGSLSVTDLKSHVRGAGLKGTASRIAVLRVLEESERPLSHADVYARVAGQGFDQATVYRNLADMTEAGLLARTDLGDHVWRFERRRNDLRHQEQHPHFVCSDCGEVACLPSETIAFQTRAGAPRSLRRRRVAVRVEGVCDTCAS